MLCYAMLGYAGLWTMCWTVLCYATLCSCYAMLMLDYARLTMLLLCCACCDASIAVASVTGLITGPVVGSMLCARL
jgi:hypothetical protein